MTNLMIIPESLLAGFSSSGLDVLSFGAIVSAILVITARNPVISVLFLIALFVNIAAYLILLGISFIGLAYITVYVGAIAILFLFVIFLLDIKLAELHTESQSATSKAELPLGAIIGIAFLYPVYSIIPSNITEMKSFSFYIFNWFNSLFTGESESDLKFLVPLKDTEVSITSHSEFEFQNLVLDNNKKEFINLDLALTNLWDGNFAAFTQISSIGNVMYTNYLLWFFVAALILLLAMVAAISLTFKPTVVSTNN